ncbi:site-Specific DNA-methyltransferase [Arthrobacter sp. Hiyo4]|nr:site-Specific DNA-methyltransferase [Arthrobacter sp. Hiyo4]
MSDFGLRSKVADTFSQMFSLASARGLQMALSYASTSLLPADKIVRLAEASGYRTEIKEIELRHSGQGQVRAKSDVTEYLFLLTHGR